MFCLDTQDNAGNGHGCTSSAVRGEGRKHDSTERGHPRGREYGTAIVSKATYAYCYIPIMLCS
jgi:hypothetical protein